MMNLLNEANNIYQKELFQDKQQLDYLLGRGIRINTIKEFEIGFSSSHCLTGLKKISVGNEQELKRLGLLNNKGNERNWNRLMFPIRDEHGDICGYNGRTVDPKIEVKYLLSPESMGFSKTKTLFNFHKALPFIKATNKVYIVEGVFDVMAMWQQGIKNVVCGLGTSLTKEQMELLKNYATDFIIGYDGDYAGFKASITNARQLSQLIGKERADFKAIEHIKFLQFPEESDPCDQLKNPHKFDEIIKYEKKYMEYIKDKVALNPEYDKVFEKQMAQKKHEKERDSVPYSQIKNLLNQLDIVEVIGHYLPLEKSGQNYKAICTFHGEKTPSLSVSPQKQIFKCFGCGEGGNAIAFVAKIEGISYKKAMRVLTERYNLKEVLKDIKQSQSKSKKRTNQLER